MKEIRFKTNLYGTQPEISKLAYQVAMQYQDYVYTNDKETVQIVFELMDVEPGDLFGHTAMMYLYMEDGSLFQKPAVIDGNEVQYILTGTEGDHPGDNKAQAQVIAADGETMHATTIEPFIVNIGLDRVIAPPEVYYESFEALIGNFNDWWDEIQDLLDENVVTNLITMINNHMDDTVAHTRSVANLPGLITNGSLIYDSTNNIYWGAINGSWQRLYLGGNFEKYTEKLVTLSGTMPTIDLSQGNVFVHTPSGDSTYSITNAVNGQAHSFTLIVNMGATVQTLTFPESVIWQGGKIPDMTTADKTYVLTFVTVDGGTVWLGMNGGEF